MIVNGSAAQSRPVGQGAIRRTTQSMPRVLLVEDDQSLAEGLMRVLEEQGCETVCATTGEEALTVLAVADFDVLVLDIGLPGIDGFEVLGRLDPARKCAVLIVSAYDRVEQRVRGLDLGADDYLVKPFAIEELEARIRALLRRSQTHIHQRVELAGLSVDLAGKRAWVNESPVDLTAREWSVLNQLLLRTGQVVSKDQLQLALGSDQQSLSDNAIEVYISRLRVKLASAGVNIRTLRGFGYMIEEPSRGPAA